MVLLHILVKICYKKVFFTVKGLTSMEQESSNTQTIENKITEDLPMITWLKGDESYFEEFSWDAKKVMEVLGIKRSRLTQISGQELRVGKARVDRYLRPFYRPEDVQNYLKWTQPTASHKRSTGIVDEARRRLEETTEELKKSLQQGPSGFQKFFSKVNRQISQNIFLIQGSFLTKIKSMLDSFRERMIFDNQRVYRKVKKLEEQVEKLQHDNKIILQQLLDRSNENSEILKQLQSMEQRQEDRERQELSKVTFPKTSPHRRHYTSST